MAKALKTISETKVKIGPKVGMHPYHPDRPWIDNQPISYADLGRIHEDGPGNRSFLAFPLRYRLPDLIQDLPPTLDDEEILFDRPEEFVNALGKLGLTAIDEAFETQGWGQWTQLADQTIFDKSTYPWLVSHPSHILVEGGDLRASITMQFMK